jgi:hypothetical protein
MPTPRIPSGFKPLVAGYGLGAPDGTAVSEVGGGLPRAALMWDRGTHPVTLSFLNSPERHEVWTVFFRHVILKGTVAFICPLDTGMGYADHLVQMIPETYSAQRMNSPWWTVAFTALVESAADDLSPEEVTRVLDLWEQSQEDYDDIIRGITKLATVDMLVLPE